MALPLTPQQLNLLKYATHTKIEPSAASMTSDLTKSVNPAKLVIETNKESFTNDYGTQNYSCKSNNVKSFILCFVIIILLFLVINSACKYNKN